MSDLSRTVAKMNAAVDLMKSIPPEAWPVDDPTPEVSAEAGMVEVYAATNYGDEPARLTPEQAVEHAKAVLAAAEEARRHTD